MDFYMDASNELKDLCEINYKNLLRGESLTLTAFIYVVVVQSPSRVPLFIPVVKLVNTRSFNWDK